MFTHDAEQHASLQHQSRVGPRDVGAPGGNHDHDPTGVCSGCSSDAVSALRDGVSPAPSLTVTPPDRVLSRTESSGAVEALGWRLLLSTVAASVPVGSMTQAAEVSAAAVRACSGQDVQRSGAAQGADGHLRVDLRPDRVELSLATRATGQLTQRDVELAAAITAALHGLGLAVAAPAGSKRPVQALEIAIDALDMPGVVPFWKAVFAYANEPGQDDPADALVDPAGQLPTIWFQQLETAREQRNRIHFDLTVAHDDADARVEAAVAAGGRVVSAAEARAFWILADPEGNEVCVCTWQDRD